MDEFFQVRCKSEVYYSDHSYEYDLGVPTDFIIGRNYLCKKINEASEYTHPGNHKVKVNISLKWQVYINEFFYDKLTDDEFHSSFIVLSEHRDQIISKLL